MTFRVWRWTITVTTATPEPLSDSSVIEKKSPGVAEKKAECEEMVKTAKVYTGLYL